MITFEYNDSNIRTTLESMPAELHDALLIKVTQLTFMLEAKIKQRLSGEVLNVITGNLRRSIFSTVEDNGNSIAGYCQQSGDVKYGAIHEFGFDGIENVKQHVRTITKAFGVDIKPKEVIVKAFTRHMKMPERSFMRSSLNDMREQIVEELSQVIGDQ
jgi:phage gpG-like protein